MNLNGARAGDIAARAEKLCRLAATLAGGVADLERMLIERDAEIEKDRSGVLASLSAGPPAAKNIPKALAAVIPDAVEVPVPPRAEGAWVYFLILGEEVVYVGQSTALPTRIGQHAISTKAFDRVLAVRVRPEDLNRCEAAAIYALQPRYNKSKPIIPIQLRADALKTLAACAGATQ